MVYRQLRAKTTEPQAREQKRPQDRRKVLYVRLSTNKQLLNHDESMPMQLSMAQEEEINSGKIFVVIEGKQADGKIKGVSGRKSIEERAGLQEIMNDLYAGLLNDGEIRVLNVSRLFRTKSRVPVETFIDACREHNVRAVTKNITYDFSLPGHDELFRQEYNFARMYNELQIGLMHESNAQQAMRGEYHGRPLTPGFIVDRDKESRTYGRYIPYEPHMEIVADLYRRLREKGVERFNELANEVIQMPFLFPPFEPAVDQRDVNQFKLKKICELHGRQCDCKLPECELIGYHIKRASLRELLQAVEHGGYWKFHGEVLRDADGQPKRNHETGVNREDWEYCFNKLSRVTLAGEPNPNYYNPRATWTPTKQGRHEPLLLGLLSAPCGCTIQYSNDTFRVMEMRPGRIEGAATLAVQAHTVVGMFLDRLEDRCTETDLAGGCLDEWLRVREHNTRALVSVDKQIARYKQSIANMQAGLAALLKRHGDKVDAETVDKFNEDINNERANLNALVAKRKAALAEENQLKELSDNLQEFIKGGFKDDEHIRRFIRLACERIELAEYSAHFATLTITWAAPFHQVDVGYIYLPNGVHENWTKQEVEDLAALYPYADRTELLQRFPARSWMSINSYASSHGIVRQTRRNSSNVSPSLALLDVEVMELLGFDPRQGYIYEDMWVKNVLVTGSSRAGPKPPRCSQGRAHRYRPP